MTKPTAAQRPPALQEPLPLQPGQARRWLGLRDRESRDEALTRARLTMPWGPRAVGVPIRGARQWVFTIVEAT